MAFTRFVVAILLLLAPLAAQSGPGFFVQLADPQFGAFTSDREFEQETANFEFAIANINRIHPAFVVVCGDLVNKAGDPAQIAEYFRITARLDRSIPVYSVPGNHDVGNEPTPESLAAYRKAFGPDYYSFRSGDLFGIVLDSSLIAAPGRAPDAAEQQETWLKAELGKARASGARHVVVFQHHSWFLEDPNEADQYFNIPREQRRRYLDLLKASGVGYVFAGHYHRNAFGKDGTLEMITNGPVGRPLGPDPSGIRVVYMREDRLEHQYYGLGSIPNRIPPVAPAR